MNLNEQTIARLKDIASAQVEVLALYNVATGEHEDGRLDIVYTICCHEFERLIIATESDGQPKERADRIAQAIESVLCIVFLMVLYIQDAYERRSDADTARYVMDCVMERKNSAERLLMDVMHSLDE